MLTQSRPTEVIPNFEELIEYIHVRDQIPRITNTSKLINILTIYFRTLLYYQSHRVNDFGCRVGKYDYKMEFDLTDRDGVTKIAHFPDIGKILIRTVFEDLSKSLTKENFEHLLTILSEIFETPAIPLDYKIHIIDNESNIAPDNWRYLITSTPYSTAINAIHERRSILTRILSAHHIDELGLEQELVDLSPVNKSYITSAQMSCEVYIRYNQYSEIFSFLIQEIDHVKSFAPDTLWDKNLILFDLFRELISYNHLFTILEWTFLKDKLSELEPFLSDENYSTLHNYCSFDLRGIEIRDVNIQSTDSDFGTDLSGVTTNISFVLPFILKSDTIKPGDYFIKSTKEDYSIYFRPITNLYDDPIFSLLTSPKIPPKARFVNGIPWAILSDSLGNVNNSTRVTISFRHLFTPDFEIVDGKPNYYDSQQHSQEQCGKYYPHKDRIVEILDFLFSSSMLPFDIEKSDIAPHLISNYLVDHLSADGVLIHRHLFTVTTLDSYQKIKNRYLNALDLLIIETDDYDLKDFLLESKFTTRKSFHDFCISLIDRTLKRSIEFFSLWVSLWDVNAKKKEPVNERKAQPIIYNVLKHLCEIRGIHLLRETIASDGSIDFYMGYTHEGNPFSVAVELKKAHSDDLKFGIQSQLPLYMKGVPTKYGIYIVLWFKGGDYSEPHDYEDINSMLTTLNVIKPKGLTIYVMPIDASQKAPPSKKDSSPRLK